MATSQTQTYRTMPARVIGWVIVIALAALAAVIGKMEADVGNNPLSPLGIMSVVAAVVWVVLLRPSVRLGEDRVELRNLVTDVVVPFSRLKSAGHEWALEVFDNAGSKYSSWAIPVRRELRPRRDIDSYAEATTRGKTAEGNNAEVVAGRVEQALQRWKLEGGRSEAGEGAHRTWAWTAIVPFLASIVLAVVTLVLG